MADRCDQCRFWAAGTEETVVGVEFRQCRRNPPSVSTRLEDPDVLAVIDHGTFPCTPCGAWCGEFQHLANHHG